MSEIIIRRLKEYEIPQALELAWKVFSEYESPDYSAEGTEEFRKCIHDGKYLSGIKYYGAFDNEKLIGEIGIRAEKGHICFFFVDGRYHRKGIGTKLFRFLLNDYNGERITLNSSPYGLPFYKAVGFKATDSEKTVNGIRFTPMQYQKERRINMNNTICGADCKGCSFSEKCKGCAATCGKPFGDTCVAAQYIKIGGKEKYLEFKKNLLDEINSLLNFNGIPCTAALYELPGFFVNLAYKLPNGETVKFLDDKRLYLGAQIEADGICFGIAADMDFIIISSYGEGGTDAELVVYKKR